MRTTSPSDVGSNEVSSNPGLRRSDGQSAVSQFRVDVWTLCTTAMGPTGRAIHPQSMVRTFTVVALACVVILAGCGGGDRTPQPLRGEATAATAGQDALSAADYEQVAVESMQVNRSGTLDVSGDVELTVNYQIYATAQRATYEHSSTDSPSVFALLSVPLVSPDAVDVTLDPMGDRSLREVTDRAQPTYTNVGPLDHVSNKSATLLGTDTTLQKYATTAEADGSTVDVYVYIAVAEHNGDLIRAVAVLPQDADAPETVRTLLESAQH